MDPFNIAFGVSAILTGLITLKAGGSSMRSQTPSSVEFKIFQRSFLVIYYISMIADWLQGPYVYALYASYGFSKHDIAVLFVGGFGASMIFGTFVGAMAALLGRKRACQLYCILYLGSCVTKHARDYNVLMLGRVLGGVATSLLFSAFESWLVCEHNASGFEGNLLSQTFSLMYFGTSCAAIAAGLMAEAAADSVALTPAASPPWYYGGYCSPFDLSAIFLALAFVLITLRWGENYGESAAERKSSEGDGLKSALSSLSSPLQLIAADPRILLCGTVISLFEGSMYIFVFNWTPAMSSASPTTPPFGRIFACFMVACMGGSSAFAWLSRFYSAELILRSVFLVASAALALPIFFKSTGVLLFSFLVFEACVGVYWPAIGTVKSRVVPESARATIYNIFRVPLNAVVLGVLLNQMEVYMAFFWCTLMLAVSFGAMVLLMAYPANGGGLDVEGGDQALMSHDDT